MKKLLFLALMLVTMHAIHAQSLDDIRNNALLNRTKDAREMIDKYLSSEKNAKKSDGWYWKGYIYNQESKDAAKSIEESSDLKSIAFDALKKYRELDSKASLLKDENNSSLFDLYIGFSSSLGVAAFQKKNPEAAFTNFKKCLDVHDYIFSNNLKGANGFEFTVLDTVLVFYTAIAAHESKNEDAAATYYQKLTDANVADSQYLQAYEFLTDYYLKKKDHTAFMASVEKGKKMFPGEDYWIDVEISEATDGLSKPDKIRKYEELMVKYPTNYMVVFNTAFEMYTYINSSDAKDINTNELKSRLPKVLDKAIAIKPTIDGNYMMAGFLYNNSIDVSEEARKMIKPADAKKKKELEAAALVQMNQAIPYAEAVVKLFDAIQKPKASEKINCRQALTILKNIYDVKKDAAKMAQCEQKLKTLE